MATQGIENDNNSYFKKLQDVKDLVEVEWLQLQRRYGKSFTVLMAEASGRIRSAKITGFQTSDPDFDKTFLPNGVTVRILLGKNYPAEAATIEIFSEELGKHVVGKINAELANVCAQTKGTPQIRNALKWLDRRLGQEKNPHAKAPIEEDVWTLYQQQALENALGEYPANMEKKKRWILIGKSVPGKDAKQCVNRFNKIRKNVVEERERQMRLLEEKKRAVELQVESMKTSNIMKDESSSLRSGEISKDQNLSTESTVTFHMPKIDESDFDKHQGIKCFVDGLEVSGIGWACIKNISVHGLCISCGLPLDINIDQSSEYKGWCASKKCSKLLQLAFEGLLLHNQNLSKIGVFESSSIIIQDILKLSMTCSCFECGTLAMVEDMVRGKASENSCHDCHKRMRILFQNINLQGETKQQLAKGVLGEFKSKVKKDPRIVPGKPLPNEGTCKHYRKSHRWLRFPCCGKAYPCDVCHELESGCDETPWARRQICGYCSKEQDFSKDLPCIHCGKSIGLAKYTSHWEGGKGQRNKVKMSAKDSKKYTNSNMKTRSNKANRVGNARKLKDKEKKAV